MKFFEWLFSLFFGAASANAAPVDSPSASAPKITPTDSAVGGASKPLGVRQNNPGNVRVSANAWIGKVQSTNGYEAADTVQHGWRMMAFTLVSYWTQHGIKSVREIIARYAPTKDGNDVEKYSRFVADKLGIGPSDALNWSSRLEDLCFYMAWYEQGKAVTTWWPDCWDDIAEACAEAKIRYGVK